ncbi:hypothetical protein CAP35_01330 [Chitinophagaceae bacterium IBVUCB1]|nr:hypothetical protein CAP35_01330 [Chitinophagaceae bacterium IBVUCB1]
MGAKYILSFSFCALANLNTIAKQFELSTQPIFFIENKGQIIDQNNNLRHDIQFKLEAPGINIFIGNGQMHYQWYKVEEQSPDLSIIDKRSETIQLNSYRMDVELLNANPNAEFIIEEKTEYYENYLLGNKSIFNVGSFRKAIYKNIYPNIDWIVYLKNDELKYDFIVHAGGDVKKIQLKYSGATSINLENGRLFVKTPLGNIIEQAPYSFINEDNKPVQSGFVLNRNILSFQVAQHKGTLVIDPGIAWATYYGGTKLDYAYSIAADNIGNSFFIGRTNSTSNVVTTGVYQTILLGNTNNGLLAKINASGNKVWGTYIGSGNTDFYGITCDSKGNIYITGWGNGITATTGSHQPSPASSMEDAILMKFNPTGNLIWATYYGGLAQDFGWNVSCDYFDNVYLCGATLSNTGISTSGGYQTTHNGDQDGFIAKFDPLGKRIWGTYFGSTGGDRFFNIRIDKRGNIYAVGVTGSQSGIATSGAHKTVTSSADGMIVKFDSTCNLQWATYYGEGSIGGLGLDDSGNVYVSGPTYATTGIATPGAYQSANANVGYADAFIAKFNSLGVRQWGSYFGGTSDEKGCALTVSPSGNAFIAGMTRSPNGIASPNALQSSLRGSADAFVAAFSPFGSLFYSSYFGGNDAETAEYYSTSYSYNGRLYIGGYTISTTGLSSGGVIQSSHNGGGYDAYVACMALDTVVYIESPFKDTLFCPNDTFKVKCLVSNKFKSGNTFSVQLSDSTGSFQTPLIIGTKVADSADSVVCIIPSSILLGAKYRIRVIANNPNCISFDNGINITIKGFTYPSVTITATPDTIIKAGTKIDFKVHFLNAGNKPSFQWQLNGTDIPLAIDSLWSSNTLSDNDKVSCIVTISDKCAVPKNPTSNIITVHVDTNTVVDNILTEDNDVVIFPNPSNGNFVISNLRGNGIIIIRNPLGQIITKLNYNADNNGKKEVQLDNLSSGIFMVSVLRYDKSVYTCRLLSIKK